MFGLIGFMATSRAKTEETITFGTVYCKCGQTPKKNLNATQAKQTPNHPNPNPKQNAVKKQQKPKPPKMRGTSAHFWRRKSARRSVYRTGISCARPWQELRTLISPKARPWRLPKSVEGNVFLFWKNLLKTPVCKAVSPMCTVLLCIRDFHSYEST